MNKFGEEDKIKLFLFSFNWFKCLLNSPEVTIFSGYDSWFLSFKNSSAGVPSPMQRLEILQTLLGGMEHSLSDLQVQHLAMATHGFVGADLAALCNEAALVCLRCYAKSEKPYDGLRFSGALNTYEGHSDIIMEESDQLGNVKDTARECSDSASSCDSGSPISSEILPSFHLNGTMSEITDNFQSGVYTTSATMLISEEEYTLKVTFEDFEKARMKVRPSAMREV